MKKKLYICGAVTNNPNYKADFAAAKENLLKARYDVVCPIDLCNEDDEWTVAMRKCIKALMDCSGVALIPSEYTSKGRDLELRIAKDFAMGVHTVDVWVEKEEEKDE